MPKVTTHVQDSLRIGRSWDARRARAHVPRRRVVRPVPHVRDLKAPQIDAERLAPQVERAVFGWGLINPLLSLPQLYNIYFIKHVAGLSAITVSAALLMAALWTIYGILGRQTVVWLTSAVWVVLNAATLAGITIFA